MKPFSQPWAPISQSPVEKKYVVHWQTLQSCSSVIHAMTIYAKHSFLSDASYAHAECGSCKITESWKLQSVVSPPLKNVCAHLHLKLSAYHITAFFNHFAAAEPSAKCLRCSWNPMQWSKCRYCYKPHWTVVANFAPGNFGLFRRNLWQPLAGPWGWKTLAY